MNERFIIGGSPNLIRALAEVAINDPELELVSVAGPPAAPERLVVNMAPERADMLRSAFGGQLFIDSDEELRPFG